MKKVHTLSTVDLLLVDIKFPANSPQPFTVAKMLSKMHCIWLKLANIWRWAETILNLKLPITHSFQHFSTCLLIIKSITEVSWWIRHLYMFPCNWYISKFWHLVKMANNISIVKIWITKCPILILMDLFVLFVSHCLPLFHEMFEFQGRVCIWCTMFAFKVVDQISTQNFLFNLSWFDIFNEKRYEMLCFKNHLAKIFYLTASDFKYNFSITHEL